MMGPQQPDEGHLRSLLQDTVAAMFKYTVSFTHTLRIEGLVTLMVDNKEGFFLHMSDNITKGDNTKSSAPITDDTRSPPGVTVVSGNEKQQPPGGQGAPGTRTVSISYPGTPSVGTLKLTGASREQSQVDGHMKQSVAAAMSNTGMGNKNSQPQLIDPSTGSFQSAAEEPTQVSSAINVMPEMPMENLSDSTDRKRTKEWDEGNINIIIKTEEPDIDLDLEVTQAEDDILEGEADDDMKSEDEMEKTIGGSIPLLTKQSASATISSADAPLPTGVLPNFYHQSDADVRMNVPSGGWSESVPSTSGASETQTRVVRGKRRGRPRKTGRAAKQESVICDETETSPCADVIPQTGRKRGRPRGSKNKWASTATVHSQSTETMTPAKPKRGRPRVKKTKTSSYFCF